MSETSIDRHDATDAAGRDRHEFIRAPDVTRDLARLKQHLANAG